MAVTPNRFTRTRVRPIQTGRGVTAQQARTVQPKLPPNTFLGGGPAPIQQPTIGLRPGSPHYNPAPIQQPSPLFPGMNDENSYIMPGDPAEYQRKVDMWNNSDLARQYQQAQQEQNDPRFKGKLRDTTSGAAQYFDSIGTSLKSLNPELYDAWKTTQAAAPGTRVYKIGAPGSPIQIGYNSAPIQQPNPQLPPNTFLGGGPAPIGQNPMDQFGNPAGGGMPTQFVSASPQPQPNTFLGGGPATPGGKSSSLGNAFGNTFSNALQSVPQLGFTQNQSQQFGNTFGNTIGNLAGGLSPSTNQFAPIPTASRTTGFRTGLTNMPTNGIQPQSMNTGGKSAPANPPNNF